MILPIVGMFFHPPAASLTKRLHQGAPLILRPEPNNPVDANAIAVHYNQFVVSYNALAAMWQDISHGRETIRFGREDDPEAYELKLAECAALKTVQLGFLEAATALSLHVRFGRQTRDIEAGFVVLASGKPGVAFDETKLGRTIFS